MKHTHDNLEPSVNQAIFKIGLSVETISIYLLCCGFRENGTTISDRNLFSVWNGTKEAFYESIKELERRNILLKIISGGEDKNVYKLTENKSWKL